MRQRQIEWERERERERDGSSCVRSGAKVAQQIRFSSQSLNFRQFSHRGQMSFPLPMRNMLRERALNERERGWGAEMRGESSGKINTL